ncbi:MULTISPECIES: PIG-L deacetylase family protein [unclassified Microbacterium]|uniref:PIG-L deacetylase family protein n=1 Tax=unclassified Microbacterium TaxID=2609290 RepID=UPI00214ADB50|nr:MULTISPECIES: PIG-L deacetylase family protein [unclassified Microbacterium]MCR2800285.1 PIG-L family deacetylase [Microbacterium sp. zg.Y818]MCR2824324.1 PIG-L family deacetylase [Microbacterium sp. zg.Y909]WIM22247.1 PIG-L deacetylase family protein [Microbacterium sp. zg-Y818]
MPGSTASMLVISAHAGDFVWRAGGAIAAAAARGERVSVVCLSYGERGESASQWLLGKSLDEIKDLRRTEATAAAAALGAEIEFLDLGDYPLRESPEAVAVLVDVYRRVQPTVVLTHTLADPYNGDHPAAARMALQARVLAQAIGVAGSDGTMPTKDEIIGAPPVFFFEPHQPEQCGFSPNVLLDITTAFPAKRAAMQALPAQQHMWSYYTDLAVRRGVQLKRNAGPNLGLAHETMGEAYMRYLPQVTGVLE